MGPSESTVGVRVMTVYELIRDLSQYEPDDEVMAAVIPKGNRKIKRDLVVTGVLDFRDDYRATTPHKVTIVARRENT